MYLKKITKKNPDRIYLIIAESYRDKETKKSKSRTIQSLGFLDELEKNFENPIAHFTKIVKEMNDEISLKNAPLQISYDTQEKLIIGTNNRKNFGYAAFSSIYHTLEIDKFLINRQRSTKIEASTNNIMKLLVFSRLLNPCSKRKLLRIEMIFSKDQIIPLMTSTVL